MPEEIRNAPTRPPTVTQRAFADLFDDIQANRKEIFFQMAAIIDDAAKGVACPRGLSLRDLKGDALAHAMGIALAKTPTYDHSRRNAHFYFHTIVRNFMRKATTEKTIDTLGDSDAEVSMEDMRRVAPQDAAILARESCPYNWRSSKIQCPVERFRAEKFFRVAMKKARRRVRETGSAGELAVSTVAIEILKQVRDAFI